MKMLIATTNPGKLREILPLVAGLPHEFVTLADLPPLPEPEETGVSFWENARLKAQAYAAASGLRTVAEDSGLEIDALDAAPGVHSARFLGPTVPYATRFEEIYRRLAAARQAPRDARFVTSLAVADPDGTILFDTDTRIEGEIAPAPAGSGGFGYDPIFWYPPFRKTTAEMTLDEKSAVSHRARAFRDFVRWLQQF